MIFTFWFSLFFHVHVTGDKHKYRGNRNSSTFFGNFGTKSVYHFKNIVFKLISKLIKTVDGAFVAQRKTTTSNWPSAILWRHLYKSICGRGLVISWPQTLHRIKLLLVTHLLLDAWMLTHIPTSRLRCVLWPDKLQTRFCS